MGKKWFQMGVVVLLLSTTVQSYAQIQAGGILRDEYALALTPSIKSLGMGGAYVGIEGTMSMNPASLSSVEGWEGSLWYGFYDHNLGPEAHRGRLDLVHPVPYIGGTSRIMIDGFVSDGAGTTLLPDPAGVPMGIEFDSITLGMQYGRNITDWWAVGFGGYPYEKANVDLITSGGTIEGEAFSQIGSIQLGTIFRPLDNLSIGGQFIYIKDDLEAQVPGVGQMGDYYHIHYFSVGASYRPFEQTLVALDYWNGEIEGIANPAQDFDVDVDRWNFGIQQEIVDYFAIRLGSNNGGLSAGFTVNIRENMDIDYAYVNEFMRDKDEIFGDTEFHGLQLTMRF